MFSLSAQPQSGPAGGSFTLVWQLTPVNCSDKQIHFSWKHGALPSVTVSSNGKVAVAIPSGAPAGWVSITATCNLRVSPRAAGARFLVTAPPTTTTPPPVTTTTRPPVTTTRPPVVTTTTRPGVTTTRPTTTTTRPTTTTTDPSVTTTTTTDTPTTPSTESTASIPPSDGDLELDRKAVHPGDPLTATGRGCVPGSPVTLTSRGERVGEATADDAGEFVTPVEFTKIEPGRHVVLAECGIVLTGAVDQVLTTSGGGGNSTTLVVLVFFVLAGGALIRFT